MAGIQQAISSLATGLAYARKVRDYGAMQKANQQVQQQRLALQQQKLEIAKQREMTKRKLANAKVRQIRLKEKAQKEDDNTVSIGGQKVSLNSLNPNIAKALTEGNK